MPSIRGGLTQVACLGYTHRWVPGAIKKADVAAWAAFMKGKGVTHAVGLLNPDELEHYEAPGLVAMLKEEGITYTATTCKTSGAADEIMAAFRAAEAAGGKAVTHCLGGGGRAPTAAGLWLVEKHALSPDAAVQVREDEDTA
jgi:hypothetical protein